jgi:hypothetical protein
VPPKYKEAAPRVNFTTTNKEVAIEPDESQKTVSDHPMEGTVEDVTDWPKWYAEVQEVVDGTSIQPPLKKDK